jgi:hypothetical protein
MTEAKKPAAKKTTKKAKAADQVITPVVLAYKGFDKNMKCRDFQYEIGKEYVHDGEVKACEGGFHACEYPLDVFNYYSPAGNKFCIVEQSGQLSRHDGDTKVASSKISIKASIDFHGLIKAAINYTVSKCKPVDPESPAYSEDENGAASSTGYQGAASSTGYQGAASSTGTRGAASSTGYQGAASSTGTRGAASSTGDYAAASSTGDYGAASSTGDYGAASSTGDYGAASSTGTRGAASSTGTRGAASSTGTRGAASSTGYQGAASSTGDYGAASSTGKDSVAMASGYQGKAKGAKGCALFLVYRNDDYKIIHAKAAIVGNDSIKPDVWYMLNEEGEFVEVE